MRADSVFLRQVRSRKNGPAQTLLIDMVTGEGDGVRLDVDLVPAFVLPLDRLGGHPRVGRVLRGLGLLESDETFFVIPKRSAKPARNPGRAWCMTFPYQERFYLLEGVPQGVAVKPLIKLVKVWGRTKKQFFFAMADLAFAHRNSGIATFPCGASKATS